MPYEIERQIIDLPIDRIRINPRNKRVHDDFDPHGRDSWLVEDIREHGVLDPVMLFPNGMLDDGHRRLFSVKYLKRATIPAIVLKATDEAAAFHSAQLARQMKVFAKCVLYREQIGELVKRGHEQRERNLRAGLGSSVADANIGHQEWIKLETILNVSRRNLTAGVKLLDRLDAMREGADADKAELAGRAEFIFRNQGIKPTLRMLDDIDAEECEIGDLEPDCGAWRSEEDEPKIKSKKRGPRRAARKPEAELRRTGLAAAAKHLQLFEKLTARHDRGSADQALTLKSGYLSR